MSLIISLAIISPAVAGTKALLPTITFLLSLSFIISILSKTPIVIFELSQSGHNVIGAFPGIGLSHFSAECQCGRL